MRCTTPQSRQGGPLRASRGPSRPLDDPLSPCPSHQLIRRVSPETAPASVPGRGPSVIQQIVSPIHHSSAGENDLSPPTPPHVRTCSRSITDQESLQAPPIPPWQPFRRLSTSRALEMIPLHRCTRTMDQGPIAALEAPLAGEISLSLDLATRLRLDR